tara:strand:- start:5499 stop:5627 length:129 start_codon:yes stop_codon:yes gene_type:complete
MSGVTNDDVKPVSKLSNKKGSCGEKAWRDDMKIRAPKNEGAL